MENLPETPKPKSSGSDCLSPALFLIMLVWTVAVAFIRHLAVFTSTINPTPAVRLPEFIGALVQLILVGVPVLAMAYFWSNSRYKAIYQTWLLALVFGLFMLPVYLLIPWAMQSQAFLQILLTLVYLALLIVLARRRTRRTAEEVAQDLIPPASLEIIRSNKSLWLFSLLTGSLSAYPWLAWGALGSLLDTILQVILALLFGLSSVFLIDQFAIRPLNRLSPNLWGNYFLGGLSAGATLLILTSGLGFGFSSIQVLLMLILPSLGWILSALPLLNTDFQTEGKFVQRWRLLLPLGVMVGLVCAAPLALVDPDELVLVASIGSGEILALVYKAAAISMFIILSLSFLLLIMLWLLHPTPGKETRYKKPSTGINIALSITTLASIIVGIVIYFSFGQPGLYGERMFVVFKDQADVSSAASIPDFNGRRQLVYQTLVEQANTTQMNIRNTLDRLGVAYTPYYLVNAIEVTGSPLLRLWLQAQPEVDRILNSPRMRPLPETPPASPGRSVAPSAPEWNLTDIGADRVWQEFGVTGQGIIVGQSDSGVQGDHPELADAYRGKDGDNNYNWFDPWNNTQKPTDIGGHGTHTLGSIIGKNTGVAPGASWIACVNLARNLGNPALYLDCMQFMLAPFPLDGDPFIDGDPSRGAHVLNNSWGCPEIEGCDANTFLFAARALRAAGIFVVASAGNDGPKCNTLNTPPPIYQEIFSVGAIDRNGDLAIFSSIGPVTADGSNRVKPDLLAPGVEVLSSLPENTYGENSGTSMAGPHVVGVVALLWSADPSLIGDINLTSQILTMSAQSYTGYLPDCPGARDWPSTASGYGIVDAYAAVQMALNR